MEQSNRINTSNHFVAKWQNTANDLYTQGAYEWASEMIIKYNKVLEIGCGTGHSTLALLMNNFRVFSVDVNEACINCAEKLLSDIGCTITKEFKYSSSPSTLMQTDIFSECFLNGAFKLRPDIVIVWNPGQVYDPIRIVDRCAEIAKYIERPLQVVERANDKASAINILSEIAIDNDIRLNQKDFKMVKWDNEGGIQLIGSDKDSIILAAAVYFPQ